jgi:two-component system LytT family response regulator
MTAWRVLVVDDERPARAKILRLLRDDARFTVVGEARNGIDALAQIEALRPDVVILDIQMPGLSGFEILDALGEAADFVVVFSTAYDAHALRAFDAHAVDYLLKPYDAARFRKAMDKACAQRQAAVAADAGGARAALALAGIGSERARLTVKTVEGPWVSLAIGEILRVSAANKHTNIFTRGGSHLVRLPLRDVAARLDDRFVRAHRSEIVNVHAVVRLEPWDHGDALLVLDDASTLVLTRTFRRPFVARFHGPGCRGADSA